jgi:hypothetical protein
VVHDACSHQRSRAVDFRTLRNWILRLLAWTSFSKLCENLASAIMPRSPRIDDPIRLDIEDSQKLLQVKLESGPTMGTDDEAIEVHGRADHRDPAGAGSALSRFA